MPRLRKQRDRLFKRPDGFRRAGQKQQCLFLPLSVFQNVHVLSPVRRDGSFSKQLVYSNQMSQFHQLAISNHRSVKMPRKAAFYGFYCNAAYFKCQDSARCSARKNTKDFSLFESSNCIHRLFAFYCGKKAAVPVSFLTGTAARNPLFSLPHPDAADRRNSLRSRRRRSGRSSP